MMTFSLTKNDWHKSIFLFFSALLSFIIAYELDIHHAYWASMPVWVVTQPSRELLVGRGIYRLLGTAIGGVLGFAIVTAPLEPISKFVLLSI
ncbi:MAG: FUSC family protein, partial [Bacteriovoracaceae bacterium]|nr:FUSC family protein [Bacteriovoracaceae bacterium]